MEYGKYFLEKFIKSFFIGLIIVVLFGSVAGYYLYQQQSDSKKIEIKEKFNELINKKS